MCLFVGIGDNLTWKSLREAKVIYRAGWPDKRNKRFGWFWVWIGPYVIGTIKRWDHG